MAEPKIYIFPVLVAVAMGDKETAKKLLVAWLKKEINNPEAAPISAVPMLMKREDGFYEIAVSENDLKSWQAAVNKSHTAEQKWLHDHSPFDVQEPK